MPTNPAETPESGNAVKIGLSDDFSGKKIDRRISVAPMMDWTDGAKTFFWIKCLRPAKNACLLYVSSILRASRFRPARFARMGAAE